MPAGGFTIKIAALNLQLQSQCNCIILNTESSVKNYSLPTCNLLPDYKLSYTKAEGSDFSEEDVVFVGKPDENDVLNYSWCVYNIDNDVVLKVDFRDHPELKWISARMSATKTTVGISVCIKDGVEGTVQLDPLIHPFGSLVLLYLMHWKKGLLIHASAVSFGDNAYLFSGVSGIGKSTMARLWRECGAQILNDDRLVLRLMDDQVKMYNNPMPNYKQHPREAVLKKIFLLKQSSKNYIKPLRGVQAFSRVLGNFIQQFYNKEMVNIHLGLVEQVLSKVVVYEVGFKPDHDIVALIKEMD